MGNLFWFKKKKRKVGCSTCDTELLAILRRTNCRHSEILQLWISLKYQHFWASLKYCQLKHPQKSLTIPKAHLHLPPLNMYVLYDTFHVPVTFLPHSASPLVRPAVRPPPVKQALCKMSVCPKCLWNQVYILLKPILTQKPPPEGLGSQKHLKTVSNSLASSTIY